MSLLLLELFCFWLILPAKALRTSHQIQSHKSSLTDHIQTSLRTRAEIFFSFIPKLITAGDTLWHGLKTRLHSALGAHNQDHSRAADALTQRIQRRQAWSLSDWTHFCLFRPLEVYNALWLCYIVFAQTVGSYNTCECQSCDWAIGGGYIDFSNFQAANAEWVRKNWTASTVVSVVFMGVPMVWVVVEWCLSSVSLVRFISICFPAAAALL